MRGGKKTWAKAALVLSVGGLFLILARDLPQAEGLPRTRLADGAEFRVLNVTYTSGPSKSIDHTVGKAPEAAFWIWYRLPKPLQDRVPYPSIGVHQLGSTQPALSIWWAYFDPKTRKPELGPADYATVTLDSGEQLKPIKSSPVEEGYRQILLTDPPKNSRRLHFRLRVEGQPVEFELDNPAFKNR